VYAEKHRRFQSPLKRIQQFTDQVCAGASVDLHIVALSFDPVDAIDRYNAYLFANPDADILKHLLWRLFLTQQRLESLVVLGGRLCSRYARCGIQRCNEARIIKRLEQVVDGMDLEGPHHVLIACGEPSACSMPWSVASTITKLAS